MIYQRALLFGVALCVSLVSSPVKSIPIHEAVELFDSANYVEFISQHENYEWNERESPLRIMLYLSALEAEQLPLRSQFGSKHSVETKFAEAYLALIEGETCIAASSFSRLAKTHVWGLIGLAEHAVYTNNVPSLTQVIDKMRTRDTPVWLEMWALPHYSLEAAMLEFQYQEAVKIAREASSPSGYSLAQGAVALLMLNELEQSEQWLDSALKAYPRSLSLVTAKSDLIAATKGSAAAASYAESQLGKFENLWEIRLLHVYHLLNSHSPEDREVGAERLGKLALERQSDLQRLIVAATVLFDLGRDDDVRELFDAIGSRSRPPADLPAYRILLAKLDRYQGDMRSVLLNLAAAEDIAPNYPELNWFRYGLAREASDWDDAKAALDRLQPYDPNSQYYLVERARTSLAQCDWRQVQVAARQLATNNRFVDPEVREDISNLLSEAIQRMESVGDDAAACEAGRGGGADL